MILCCVIALVSCQSKMEMTLLGDIKEIIKGAKQEKKKIIVKGKAYEAYSFN
ncbi:hypothetical protein [Proteiniborus sp. MB09-C3]|uniref:hypothetical protein n=1 Tax=Proteiniborus sp. MB09-C3 TaxID=3050072 RepID=UPI002555D8B7|nr:hypothetical protein [Proteiniborus sp. MB09-C3]WIV12450.1 hypothetical protein QO263_01610 [Proteiniborus sp. MB09-C3]